MDGLRWLLAGVGALVIALIYVWGMRVRIREELRKRRRGQNEPMLGANLPPAKPEDHSRDDYASLDPNHPLADKVLVDITIGPPKSIKIEPTANQVDAQRLLDMTSELGSTDPDKRENREPKADDINGSDDLPRRGRWGTTNARREQEPELAETPSKSVVLTVMAPTGHDYHGVDILRAAQQMQLKLHKKGLLNCLLNEQVAATPVFSIAHLKEPGLFDLESSNELRTPGLLLFMQLPGPLEPLAAVDFMLGKARRLTQALGGTVCDERFNKLTTQSTAHLRSEAAEFERRLRLSRPHP